MELSTLLMPPSCSENKWVDFEDYQLPCPHMPFELISDALLLARNLVRSSSLISKAFYRVLRPLITGSLISDEMICTAAARLNLPANAIADLHAKLAAPCALDCAGLHPLLRDSIRSLHTDTHFWIQSRCNLVKTTQALVQVILLQMWFLAICGRCPAEIIFV